MLFLLGCDIRVRMISFPYSVKAVTLPCDDGTFDIYVNSRLPDNCQEAALTHELEHIKKDHFYNYDSVVINEMVANKAV